MHILKRPRWFMPEREATPESVFLNRRTLLAGAAAALPVAASAQRVDDDPTVAKYQLKRNAAFTLDRPVTEETHAANYNNFYEFGTSKSIQRAAQALKIRPWTLTIDGLVEKPIEVGFDDLFNAMPKEERLYRFRCVETWAMAVPWSGFPLKALLAYAKPMASAKYVRFETFLDPAMAPGQRSKLYTWPYVEGVSIAEAGNDLAFVATGIYGKPLAKQFGAPIRLVLPWKYGFKSIKSIRKITFSDQRPVSLWEAIQPSEYGFWANVNPEVPHPRWSQANEEMLGTSQRRPTLLYNGYGPEVAGLYAGLKGEKLFM